ncbi:hypothetical protein EB796_020484 [Bugula neritina]|uniref:Uncharacterized protein n=1 Tax=Bugula neritina TaxID=10212 RepID=A0A7J7J4U4_BUGNE|nr:hypothetical protein EB796_020484 [Bugula neritina]
MTLTNTLNNIVFFISHYINSWINYAKLKLGLIKEKHGIIGYFQYEGLPLSSTIHNEDVMKSIKDYDDFKPDDVILVTYPKTGACYAYFTLFLLSCQKTNLYFICDHYLNNNSLDFNLYFRDTFYCWNNDIYI